MDPFEVFDVTLAPYRVIVAPAGTVPGYVQVDPAVDLVMLRHLLASAELYLMAGPLLRARARAWLGLHVPGDSHAELVERVMVAIESGALVATIIDLADAARPTSINDIRAIGQQDRPMQQRLPGASVATMDYKQKLLLALEVLPESVGERLGAAARREIEQLLSPQNIAITAGVLIVWAGSHAVGAGFVVSGVLLGVGIAFAGWDAIDAFNNVREFFAEVESARSQAQLKRAADKLADAIALLGVAGFKVLLRKVTPKRMRGTGSADEGGTSIGQMPRGRHEDTGTALGNTSPAQSRRTGRGGGDGEGDAAPSVRRATLSPKMRAYVDDIEAQTGRAIKPEQKQRIADHMAENPDLQKLSRAEQRRHRNAFNSKREEIISDWERETGQSWPRYADDVLNDDGVVLRRAGGPYDAHHVIESSHGGPNEWWNMHPAAFPNEHQGGIHRAGSPVRDIFR